MKSHTLHLTVAEERKKEREEKIHIARLQQANARETGQRTYETDLTEHYYNLENNIVEDCCDTSPLLLDAVLTPISECVCSCLPENSVHAIHCKQQVQSARQERDQVLSFAHHYRDLAEASQAEERTL